eukprot:tig00000194_g14809.t1
MPAAPDHKHKGLLHVSVGQARQIKKPFFAALTGSCVCELRTPDGKVLETGPAKEVAGELVWNERFSLPVEPGALLSFQLDVVFRGPLHVSALAGRIAIDYVRIPLCFFSEAAPLTRSRPLLFRVQDKMLEEGRSSSDKWFFIYKGDAEESGAVHLVLQYEKEGAAGRGSKREIAGDEAGLDLGPGDFPSDSPLKRRAKAAARGDTLPTARGAMTERSAEPAPAPERAKPPRSLEGASAPLGLAPPPGLSGPPRAPHWSEQAAKGRLGPGEMMPPPLAARQVPPLKPLPMAERERLESKAASGIDSARSPPPLSPPLSSNRSGAGGLKLPPIGAPRAQQQQQQQHAEFEGSSPRRLSPRVGPGPGFDRDDGFDSMRRSREASSSDERMEGRPERAPLGALASPLGAVANPLSQPRPPPPRGLVPVPPSGPPTQRPQRV